MRFGPVWPWRRNAEGKRLRHSSKSMSANWSVTARSRLGCGDSALRGSLVPADVVRASAGRFGYRRLHQVVDIHLNRMRAFAEARHHLATQFLESDFLFENIVDKAWRTALPGLHLTMSRGYVGSEHAPALPACCHSRSLIGTPPPLES